MRYASHPPSRPLALPWPQKGEGALAILCNSSSKTLFDTKSKSSKIACSSALSGYEARIDMEVFI